MESWLMDCFAFYCISVGVGVIVYLSVKAFLFIAQYEENATLKTLQKTVKERDEQIEGLRAIVDKLREVNFSSQSDNKKNNKE